MKEKKVIDIIGKFANSHSIAVGGNIVVDMYEHGHGHGMTPKEGTPSMKYEDVIFLDNAISGARQFCYYLMRNKYDIVRRK